MPRACSVIQSPEGLVSVCEASFSELYADSSVNGTHVRVTGYVAEQNGLYVLFRGKDEYFYSAGSGGVELVLDTRQAKSMAAELESYDGPMTVVGYFSRGRSARTNNAIGKITVSGTRFWQQELPGQVPRPPSK